MNLILWVVLFALIGLGKYAIGEIKQNRKTKGIALAVSVCTQCQTGERAPAYRGGSFLLQREQRH